MMTVGREHLTANEFREALLTTPRGGTVTYFTGELGYDLHMAALAKDPGAAELRLVVSLALQGSDAGELALTQRRISRAAPATATTPATTSSFEYRATKIRPEFRLAPRFARSAQEIGAAA